MVAAKRRGALRLRPWPVAWSVWAWLAGLMVALAVSGCQWHRAAEPPGQPAAPQTTALQAAELSSFTMGTYVTVQALAPTQAKAQEAAAAVISVLGQLSSEVDRFAPDSQVARINQAAGNGQWVQVSPRLFALIEKAKEAAELTHGVFDPTIGPLVDLWGFVEATSTSSQDNSAAEIGPAPIVGRQPPSAAAIRQARALVNYRDLLLDSHAHAVRLRRVGQILDLGGIAKGFGAELAAQILREHGVTQGLVDLGGNIYALGRKPDGSLWRAGIKDPRSTGAVEAVAVLPVTDQALSTSGDYERYFIYQGVRYCHLLDPRTGYPARSVMSATVITANGALGDALSTAVFILGPTEGTALLQKAGAEAIWIKPDFTIVATPGLRPQVELRGRARWAQ